MELTTSLHWTRHAKGYLFANIEADDRCPYLHLVIEESKVHEGPSYRWNFGVLGNPTTIGMGHSPTEGEAMQAAHDAVSIYRAWRLFSPLTAIVYEREGKGWFALWRGPSSDISHYPAGSTGLKTRELAEQVIVNIAFEEGFNEGITTDDFVRILRTPPFPQHTCPLGPEGECAYAGRGVGLGCTTCGHYLHPGDDGHREVAAYYAHALAEPEPCPKA